MKIGQLQAQKNNAIDTGNRTGKTRKTKKTPNSSNNKVSKSDKSFDDILNEKIDGEKSVKFSAHATKRIQQRDIQMNATKLSRLNKGIAKAEDKGSENSVVLMDKDAYVVSVKNKTVITAVPENKTKNNVFTNIDSVTIV